MTEALIKKKDIIINREFCKGCRICVAFCPEHVLELDDDEKAVVSAREKCTACGLCERLCPDIAVEIKE